MPIIYTNGGFDLLHPGHIHLLKFGLALGTVIVGLDSDARYTVRKKSPTFLFEERKAMLEFGGVTVLEVTSESDIYQQLKLADIYIKGKDAASNDAQKKLTMFAQVLGLKTIYVPTLNKDRYSSSNFKGSSVK